MKLKEWIELRKPMKTKFAKTIGVRTRTLYDYINERIEPGLKAALAIRNETKNEVTLEEMVLEEKKCRMPK